MKSLHYQAVVQTIANDRACSAILAVAFVDVSTGRTLAVGPAPRLDLDAAAPYYAEIVRQKQRAMGAQQTSLERLREIVISFGNHYSVMALVDEGRAFCVIVADAATSNPVATRHILSRYLA
jgi:hypothetical protein